jgi:hypothetical protein
MNTSHILVFQSLAFSIILAVALIIYRFCYPKKKIPLAVLLILISLLPIASIFRPGSYESGDMSFHIMEGMSFYKSMIQGNLIPVWGGDMNATYGYPVFQFFYILPFYVISFFHFLGFSFTDSTKLVFGISFVASGYFMYLWLKEELTKVGAFVGSLFYLFAPYHLIDMHFRADIGEVVALSIIPLNLFFVRKFFDTSKNIWIVLESISVGLLILSHPAFSLLGVGMTFLYMLYLVKKTKAKKRLGFLILELLSLSLGILLVSFYLVPLILNLKYVVKDYSIITYLNISDLLYSPYRYGFLFQGPQGQLSFLVGYTEWVVILSGLFLIYFKKSQKKYSFLLKASEILLFIALAMMLKISNPLWQELPLIRNFQNSYRLYAVILVLVAVIAAVVAENIKKKWIVYVICVLVIFQGILNWGNRKNLPEVNDVSLRQEIPFKAFHGGGLSQAISIWSDPTHPFSGIIPKSHLEVISGDGIIQDVSRTHVKHEYKVVGGSNLILRENTLYFPGWTAYVDGQKTNISILKNSVPKGVMSIAVASGYHKVEFIFKDTPERIKGKLISLFSVFAVLILFINKNIRRFFNKRIKA